MLNLALLGTDEAAAEMACLAMHDHRIHRSIHADNTTPAEARAEVDQPSHVEPDHSDVMI